MPLTPVASDPIWGEITGALSAQTDLQAALDAKQSISGLGSAAFQPSSAFDTAGSAAAAFAAAVAASQPLDSDLTAIAALTTTSFGRSLLTQSDAAATRSAIGAGTSSFDGAFSSLSGKPTTLSGYGITDALPLTGGTLTGPLSFSGTTNAGIKLNNLTTAERNALTGAAGTLIWNTTTSRVNRHNGTSWSDGFVAVDGDTMTGSLIATAFEARNSTTATSLLLQNTYTSSTNRETGYARWASNIFSIGTEKGSGGGTARQLRFEVDGISRMSFSPTNNNVAIAVAGSAQAFNVNTDNSGQCSAELRVNTSSRSATFGFVDSIASDSWRIGRNVGSTIFYIQPGFAGSGNISGSNGIAITNTGVLTIANSLIHSPSSSISLSTNGQLAFEMTSNTAGNIVYRGSDGTTRRFAFTVS